MIKPFEWPVKVYIEDTDAGGVVYHANHLKYCERARTEMLLAAGIDHASLMRDDGIMFVVRKLVIDYLKPAMLGDDLAVHSTISKTGMASLEMQQKLVKNNTVIAAIDIVLVCVTTKGQPCRIPAAIISKISE